MLIVVYVNNMSFFYNFDYNTITFPEKLIKFSVYLAYKGNDQNELYTALKNDKKLLVLYTAMSLA